MTLVPSAQLLQISNSVQAREVCHEDQIIRREQIRLNRSLQMPGMRSASPGHSAVFVSVIVLNLNGAPLLSRCLAALLSQTHRNLEVLVVDNGSSDNSHQVVNTFAGDGRVRWVSAGRNLGCAGGRNFSFEFAQGEVIAFIDNDGFADPHWIERALGVLLEAEDIGAVASLVFFDSDKLRLNGAGGGVNRLGYAADLCFNQTYESAQFSIPVYFPMGCGMILKRKAAELIFPLDDLLLKWYDDVEVGIRIWRKGLKVHLAPDAIIDHLYRGADSQIAAANWKRAFLFEAARLRFVIKYTPASLLGVWLINEIKLNFSLDRPRHLVLGLLVWGWNFIHLPSAIKARIKFQRSKSSLCPPESIAWGRDL